MVDYQKTLANRFQIKLAEYKGNIYLHLRDTRFTPGKPIKSITLHADGLLELAQVLPEIVALIKKYAQDTDDLPPSDIEEEQHPPPKRKRQWKGAEKNY